jgi:hypothetical protein
MNRIQFIRLFGVVEGGAPTPPLQAPSNPNPGPVIVSAETGVYKEGVMLSVEPGTYTGTVTTRTYQWKLNNSAIVGATSAFYTPVHADAGGTITVAETVANAAGSLTTTSAGVGPIQTPAVIPDDLGDAYDGVSEATMLRRQTWATYFDDNAWPGYEDQAFFTDILATSSSDFETKFNALVRTDRTKWHRIRLDSTQPASAWASGLRMRGTQAVLPTGAKYGGAKDLSTYGGGVLVESSDVNNPVQISFDTTAGVTFEGARGCHLRNVIIAVTASAATQTARTAAKAINIKTNSGFWEEMPVVRIENCKIGGLYNPNHPASLAATGWKYFGKGIFTTGTVEQVDVINCEFNGNDSAIIMGAVHMIRRWGNDFRNSVLDNRQTLHQYNLRDGNSNWEEIVYIWDRLNTVRDPYDDKEIAFAHADADQTGTPYNASSGTGDKGGYRAIKEFECVNTPRLTYMDQIYFNVNTNPTVGQTLIFRDKTFTFVTAASNVNEITIGSNKSITAQNINLAMKANIPANTYGTGNSADRFIVNINGFTASELGGTASISVQSGVRYGNNTQGNYNDDTPYAIELVDICSIRATGTGNSGRTWGGTYDLERCYFGRTSVPPSATAAANGFNYSIDPEANITIATPYSGYVPTQVNVTNSVVGLMIERLTNLQQPSITYINRNSNGIYGNGSDANMNASGNIFVSHRGGVSAPNRPEDKLAGTFTRDSEGRLTYSITAGLTQAQFRTALYDQFKLSNSTDRLTKGPTSPATWPAA